MSDFSDRKPASVSVFSGLFDWSRTHLYLSPANIVAAVIAFVATIEVIENCTYVNQLELGIFAVPFIACLDMLFITVVASLFVRKPSGFCLYLGFITILIVPKVGSIVVVGVLRSLAGVHHVPDEATSRLIEGSSTLVLSLIYFWDIVSRMHGAKQCKATT